MKNKKKYKFRDAIGQYFNLNCKDFLTETTSLDRWGAMLSYPRKIFIFKHNTSFIFSDKIKEDLKNNDREIAKHEEEESQEQKRELVLLKQEVDTLNEQIKAMSSQLRQLERKVEGMTDEKQKDKWTVGCPKKGITNGRSCFALGEGRANYSQAIRGCESQVKEICSTSSKTCKLFSVNMLWDQLTGSHK